MKSPKPKVCRQCKAKFSPRNSLQIACSLDCAKLIGQKTTIKNAKVAKTAQKRELIRQKEAIKSRKEWIQDAQKATNAYIRARDYGKPCISCGKETKAGDHAGHWKPTSSSPELRFEELNIHLQCIQCNLHLHGNVAKYREGLIRRIGLEKVEWLERKHEPKKHTIAELKELKELFKCKLKELKQ